MDNSIKQGAVSGPNGHARPFKLKGKRMTRNLKTLGLALVAALALSALTASAASASSALFTANVGPGEQAEIHGEQNAAEPDTFTITDLPPLTCTTATETGFPEENGTHKAGSSAPSATFTPTYDTCHVKIGVLTRTVTVTLNGCTYTFTATKNTASTPFAADLTINCPGTNKIEIHVYNISNHIDTGAATLCTFEVGHQTVNDKIELTNTATHDIEAHIEVPVAVHSTIQSATCGQGTNPTAIYHGTHTLRATNEADQFVNTTVS